MKKDNTLFYLLFVIAVFMIISLAKTPSKKEKPETPEDMTPEPVEAPDTETEVNGVKVPANNVYQSNGNKYINNSAPQPSNPNSSQYDYNQEGLAGTLKKGAYTK